MCVIWKDSAWVILQKLPLISVAAVYIVCTIQDRTHIAEKLCKPQNKRAHS